MLLVHRAPLVCQTRCVTHVTVSPADIRGPHRGQSDLSSTRTGRIASLRRTALRRGCARCLDGLTSGCSAFALTRPLPPSPAPFRTTLPSVPVPATRLSSHSFLLPRGLCTDCSLCLAGSFPRLLARLLHHHAGLSLNNTLFSKKLSLIGSFKLPHVTLCHILYFIHSVVLTILLLCLLA